MSPTTRRTFLGRAAAASAALAPGGAFAAALRAGRAAQPEGEATSRLLAAVAQGRTGEARRLLDARPELLGSRDEAGRSLLALAGLNRHQPVIELLLERGHEPDLHESALLADWSRFDALATAEPEGAASERVNGYHPIGGTALWAAAYGGAGADLWRVYRYGARPEARPEGGHSAARVALEHPDLEVAEIGLVTLLSNGAPADEPEPDGVRALHVAARRGSATAVEILLRKGADVSILDPRGRSARELAEESGAAPAIALLAAPGAVPRDRRATSDAFDVHGERYRPPNLEGLPVLQRERTVGAAHFQRDVVEEQIAADARLVHAVATTTERTVEACAHTGQLAIVELLLERGAPYSLPTAAVRGDVERVTWFLDRDPDLLNERGAHDFALLWYPVIGRQPEVLERLLERGAAVEDQHLLGTTALHFAAAAGEMEMAELLLEHGADVDRVGRKFGAPQSPLAVAEQRQRGEMVAFLRSRGARS